MILRVDLSSPTPVYLQIVDCVRRAIAVGSLKAGDRLPAIREGAVQTRVNRNTVSRAYLELEHRGLVRARQGSGFYVTDNGSKVERAVRREALLQQVKELVVEARLAGTPTEQLVEALVEHSKMLEAEHASTPDAEQPAPTNGDRHD